MGFDLNDDLEGAPLIQNNAQPQDVGFDMNDNLEGALVVQNNAQPQVYL